MPQCLWCEQGDETELLLPTGIGRAHLFFLLYHPPPTFALSVLPTVDPLTPMRPVGGCRADVGYSVIRLSGHRCPALPAFHWPLRMPTGYGHGMRHRPYRV